MTSTRSLRYSYSRCTVTSSRDGEHAHQHDVHRDAEDGDPKHDAAEEREDSLESWLVSVENEEEKWKWTRAVTVSTRRSPRA